jgi:hypothetical protein
VNQDEVIDVFVINYNGKNTVCSTIESLYQSEGLDISITVIDDHSNDDSVNLVREKFPEITIIEMPLNNQKANVLRNMAIGMAKSPYVLVTDNDLYYDKKCLINMYNIIKSDEMIATCTPRLMYWNQPNRVYSADTKIHFIGAAISDFRGQIIADTIDQAPSTNSGNGICLLRREIALKTGGFDENLLQGWGSDGEFYQRLLLAGYKCLYIPTASALHEDKLNVLERKHRIIGQTHNRWIFILSHYSLQLIFLLIPAILAYEFLILGFTIKNGILNNYLKGNFLVLKNFPYVLKKRKFVQSLRVKSDKDVLYSGNIFMAPSLISKNKFVKYGLNILSSMLNIYWHIIKRFIP